MTFGYDTASIRVEPDGHVRVAVGLHNHGQGHETTIAQLAAYELGIDAERHRRHLGRHRDRALRPGHVGEPQHGDQRQRDAAGRARHQGARSCASRRRCSRPIPATSTSRTGACSCAARPRATCPSAPWRAGPRTSRICCPGTRSRGWRPRAATCRPTRARSPAPPHAAHVELDAETGAVRILRYVVAEDCGTMVNPLIVEGQVHGGVAQGIGGALYEHLVYDEAGTLISGSFMDYLIPTAAEIPDVDVCHLESPTPLVPRRLQGHGRGRGGQLAGVRAGGGQRRAARRSAWWRTTRRSRRTSCWRRCREGGEGGRLALGSAASRSLRGSRGARLGRVASVRRSRGARVGRGAVPPPSRGARLGRGGLVGRVNGGDKGVNSGRVGVPVGVFDLWGHI